MLRESLLAVCFLKLASILAFDQMCERFDNLERNGKCHRAMNYYNLGWNFISFISG